MTQRTFSYIYIVLLSAMLAIGLASCDNHDDPTPEPEPEPEAIASRTVLVYQVASNNSLDNLSTDDLKEMLRGAADGAIPEGGRLMVYNHRASGNPYLIEVTAAGADTLLTYSTDIPSVSSDRMLEVFADVAELATAEDYGLILWGHGTGWLQDGIPDAISPEVKSYGGQGPRPLQWMNITTLAATVAASPVPMSFVYFDCCHMASVEVAYELRNATDIIAGSVSELPGEGMPYHLTLPYFFTPEQADIVGAARTTFEYYNEWYTIGKRPECSPSSFSGRYTAMSVFYTEPLDDLADITAAIYNASPDAYPERFVPQRFGRSATGLRDYFFDYEQYVETLCLDQSGNERFDGAAAMLAEFRSVLERCVVYKDTMPFLYGGSYSMLHYCGLSTYISPDKDSLSAKNYNTLSWFGAVASYLNYPNDQANI